MDSGVKSSQGLIFVNSYTYSDCALLVKVLHKNFGVKASLGLAQQAKASRARIHYKGVSSHYSIYIPRESMINLRNKISIYIIPEMKYKLLGSAN